METLDTPGKPAVFSAVRETILERALALFAAKGYESVGIQELTVASGITKPSLYYHFGSKQGLLETIIREKGDALREIFREETEYRHNLTNNLMGLFQGTLRVARNQPEFFRFLLSCFSSAPENAAYTASAPLRGELAALLEGLFAAAVLDHGNMRDRQRIYAETFFGLLETWALLAVNGEIEVNPPTEYRIVHQFMHGIFS
ncbi:MAG: TetR/AcrR family transcriptional regulator [Treponema sp.]|jgi:TetR/AcrR family transcriptional regulator|nr:TetR/AcrR family transcriptional regulator [Treponema sp.]